MPVTPTVDELNILNRTVSGLAVKLYKNNIEPSPDTTLETIEEATFSGYAPYDPAPFGVPIEREEAGQYEALCQTLNFNRDVGDVSNTIYGFYVTMETSAGPYLVAIEKFRKPRPMIEPGEMLTFAPTLYITDPPEIEEE